LKGTYIMKKLNKTASKYANILRFLP
jgi:hypothetical protein